MRLRAGRLLIASVVACVLAFATSGCENPFDPIDKSDKIEGLSYVDFSLSWERWDSDPLFDGVIVKLSYYGQYGDGISFKGKDVGVTIEFHTQVTTGEGEGAKTTYGPIFFSYPITVDNSDDDIRIPIEAYQGTLPGAGSEDVDAFVIVRVRPPKDSPQPELVIGYPDQNIYRVPANEVTPNG